jgi:hypothetical protein
MHVKAEVLMLNPVFETVFFNADGSRDPFWEAIRERCGKVGIVKMYIYINYIYIFMLVLLDVAGAL